MRSPGKFARTSFLIPLCLCMVAQGQMLPRDYKLDEKLALDARPILVGDRPILKNSEFNQVGESVFRGLIKAGGYRIPFDWQLTLLAGDEFNAASSAGGKVYIYGGMLNVVGKEPGLWASLLAHEIIHTALRHQVDAALRREQFEAERKSHRAQNVDQLIQHLFGDATGAMVLGKLDREQENEADVRGVRLMARAGFHPDYAFALHKKMEALFPDDSRLQAFFSSHPRWSTRDARLQKAYLEALQIFHSSYPDAASSPGGTPPVVLLSDEFRIDQRKGYPPSFEWQFHCLSSGGRFHAVLLVANDLPALYRGLATPIPADKPVAIEQGECSASGASQVRLRPDAALLPNTGKYYARVVALGENSDVMAASPVLSGWGQGKEDDLGRASKEPVKK